ncbi:MAG: histidine triad nucleotide-binding protein [Candidatus Brennerbacteria bacterium]|nr:histidine triad nucleotide-binding protein [Candidatus Brennerbacteria bacterium]
MEDCVFCKIVKRELPSSILHEDDEVIAFKDIEPAAPIHYLVVPKEHIESIGHLHEAHAAVVAKLIFIAKKLAEDEGLKGYKLVFNVGREGGQIVDHLHLHILGGWTNR